MKLQILVPQYKETDEIIKPLLDSIATQQAADLSEVGVIIVNDGTDVKLSDELLKSYPYKIEYYTAPHRGVSATRNTCLDYASADYVMFCDADDMFYNITGLYSIYREIDKGFDTLTSTFVEEAKVDGQIMFLNHKNDTTFVHGKIHRRAFLIENNIRWNPDLKIHEDSFFNCLCWVLAPNKKYLSDFFYLWRYREGSVCREDPQYLLKTYPQLIDSVDALVREFEKRGKHSEAVKNVVTCIIKMYYEINKPMWRDKANREFLDALNERMSKFYKKYKEFWNEGSLELKQQACAELRDKAAKAGMLIEEMTLNQWIVNVLQIDD